MLIVAASVAPKLHAEEAPAMKAESSSIKPAAERQLGDRERPTVKKKQEQQAASDRSVRVSLQIPERLRAALAKKIDRRIATNIAETRKLRKEARSSSKSSWPSRPKTRRSCPRP